MKGKFARCFAAVAAAADAAANPICQILAAQTALLPRISQSVSPWISARLRGLAIVRAHTFALPVGEDCLSLRAQGKEKCGWLMGIP